MSKPVKNKGWMVTLSGTGINLALGILYTWSIFKGAIKQSIETGGKGAFDWDLASLNDPYATCCIVFAFAMILAGKCQDRFGPRITAFIGGILVGPTVLANELNFRTEISFASIFHESGKSPSGCRSPPFRPLQRPFL